MPSIANQLQPQHQHPLFQQHLQAYQLKLHLLQQLKLQQLQQHVFFAPTRAQGEVMCVRIKISHGSTPTNSM